MRRRPQDPDKPSVAIPRATLSAAEIGLVLSGGGSRAAYQAGALRALLPYIGVEKSNPISVIIGSSIGAINGLVLSACLKKGMEHATEQLEDLWRERTFRNTFSNSPSTAFFRAIRMAVKQYMAPGPSASDDAIFNPAPLMERIDGVINDHGGLAPHERAKELHSVAVMTTVEGPKRKPLLFVSTHKPLDDQTLHGASFDVCYVERLSAKYGFASAALPSVLPPVELDTDQGTVRLVDGGISQNVPVDPAVRLGAHRVILIDISGRHWWLDRYGEQHDTRPSWEVPADFKTFCLRPPDTFVIRTMKPLGPILRDAVKVSTSRFIKSVGPVWPLFSLLKNKLGEDAAFEAMTYVALDPDYLQGLIERGYEETKLLLKNKSEIEFAQNQSFDQWARSL